MKNWIKWLVTATLIAITAAAVTYNTLPVNRINHHSLLIILGDLDGDSTWSQSDEERLKSLLSNFFLGNRKQVWILDVYFDGSVDEEDIHFLHFLHSLHRSGDPYVALAEARAAGKSFPRPREFFRNISREEYLSRPI
ncbi:MAG: hypothetical protein RL189_1591 [Pseudomonadota bacterium]|jgi:hypothetical protein